MNKAVKSPRINLTLLYRFFTAVILLSILGCTPTAQKPVKSVDQLLAEQHAAAEKIRLRDEAIRKNLKAERIVIFKSKRTMTLYALNKPIATYKIALGREPIGPKTCAGDYRTPEGIYTITRHKSDSRFHLALQISYPSANDIRRAKKLGCKPGHNVMIHGLENGKAYVGTAHRSVDWTNGCIAVTNQEMDQLWAMVKVGTVVEIWP